MAYAKWCTHPVNASQKCTCVCVLVYARRSQGMPAPLMRWAWTSRGLVSYDQMRAWWDLPDPLADAKQGKYVENELFELNDKPVTEKTDDATVATCRTPSAGEVRFFWQVSQTPCDVCARESATWVATPAELEQPLERQLAGFHAERAALVRCVHTTDGQQKENAEKRLEEFMQLPMRTVLFDRKSKRPLTDAQASSKLRMWTATGKTHDKSTMQMHINIVLLQVRFDAEPFAWFRVVRSSAAELTVAPHVMNPFQ